MHERTRRTDLQTRPKILFAKKKKSGWKRRPRSVPSPPPTTKMEEAPSDGTHSPHCPRSRDERSSAPSGEALSAIECTLPSACTTTDVGDGSTSDGSTSAADRLRTTASDHRPLMSPGESNARAVAAAFAVARCSTKEVDAVERSPRVTPGMSHVLTMVRLAASGMMKRKPPIPRLHLDEIELLRKPTVAEQHRFEAMAERAKAEAVAEQEKRARERAASEARQRVEALRGRRLVSGAVVAGMDAAQRERLMQFISKGSTIHTPQPRQASPPRAPAFRGASSQPPSTQQPDASCRAPAGTCWRSSSTTASSSGGGGSGNGTAQRGGQLHGASGAHARQVAARGPSLSLNTKKIHQSVAGSARPSQRPSHRRDVASSSAHRARSGAMAGVRAPQSSHRVPPTAAPSAPSDPRVQPSHRVSSAPVQARTQPTLSHRVVQSSDRVPSCTGGAAFARPGGAAVARRLQHPNVAVRAGGGTLSALATADSLSREVVAC